VVVRNTLKIWGIGIATALLGAAAGVTVASSAGARSLGTQTIRVIEHANTDTIIDIGKAGDSTGDLLTFHNPVFNGTDTKRVGRDQGHCVRISPRAGSFECAWTTFLAHGKLMVEGPFFETHESTFAITGGTGRFREARGAMLLRSRHKGSEFEFIFNVHA
jgi:allene oxide cyclase